MGIPEGKGAVRPAPACQVCGEALADRAVVLCSRCKTAHHLECWRYNKGCSVYGCGCRTSVEPPAALVIRPDEPFEITSRLYARSRIPGAGAAALGALVAALAAAAASVSEIAFGLVFFLLGALVASAVTWQLLLRQRIRVDPQAGRISKTILLGSWAVSTEEGWLGAEDIAEIHLHREILRSGQTSRVKYSLHALKIDGVRYPLMTKFLDPAVDRDEEIRLWAERLAHFADCTVREIEGDEPPSSAQIEEALELKRIEEARPNLSPSLPEEGPHETLLVAADEDGDGT